MTFKNVFGTQKKQSQEPSDSDEEIKPDNEELNFNNADFTFIPKGNCQYRQEGIYIICQSCELQHAVFIGMEKIMVGLDSNGPIIKNRMDVLSKQA